MFCYQCEQTAKGEACKITGVCGKTPEVAALQDLLIHALQGLALTAVEGRKVGVVDNEVNIFTCEGIFATLTNVDFDPQRFVSLIKQAVSLREALKQKLKAAGGKTDLIPQDACNFNPASDLAGLVKQGEAVGLNADPTENADIKSLKHLLLFGIKGVAAYADHAKILGQEDELVYAFIQESLANILRHDLGLTDWIGLVLKCGEINLRAMELLDTGNTATYGQPVPTEVPLGCKSGKAILISGHDLKDLEVLLKQTAGLGINIYTHGEMLPAHAYPELKKYPHLYGHYGSAWQNQHKEFAEFPGAILMTTNCLQKPASSYHHNIFTTGLVGWPQVAHIDDRGPCSILAKGKSAVGLECADKGKDFSPVIKKALALPGFPEDRVAGKVMVGFARDAVLGVADKVIKAVKNKEIRHFFLVGGCDGAKSGRNYYTEFVEKVPQDCLVLTLACGKFRFFDKNLGDIGGIPRLLDVGQCNDAYSAVQIALALAKAFNCGVNELPLSLIISWYEQKAVAILLSLLHLGIKDIRLGPTLPAFISPKVLQILVDNFAIGPISTPDEDLGAILG